MCTRSRYSTVPSETTSSHHTVETIAPPTARVNQSRKERWVAEIFAYTGSDLDKLLKSEPVKYDVHREVKMTNWKQKDAKR